MVRSNLNRIEKYGKKIDGKIIGQRYDATKKLAVDSQTKYFARAEQLELKVKSIVSGASSITHHFYIAFAEEFAKKKTASERSIIFNKWVSRGLSWFYLLRIASGMFNQVPEMGGVGVIPPTAAYYSFHSGQGNTAYDLGGNNRHGTLAGGVTWATGKIGNCLSYDGINGTVDINYDFPELVTANRFTFSFWARNVIDLNTPHTLFRMWGTGVNSLYFALHGTQLDRFVYGIQIDGVWQEQTITITGLDNREWHNYIITWDGITYRIYIDGVEEYTWVNAGNLSSVAGDMFLGARGGTSHWYNGQIDEFIIYPRALSETEALQYYNATRLG